jgi:plastocyanin
MTVATRRLLAFSILSLGGCGGQDAAPAPASEAGAPAPAAASGPAATGTVIELKAITDEQGNRFEPREVEARTGDVLRVVLVSGVHNINFPADQNPGAQGLPGPSEMLQLPGQTLDVPIAFGPGEYAFQCDPHAALGMTGKLKVEDEHAKGREEEGSEEGKEEH